VPLQFMLPGVGMQVGLQQCLTWKNTYEESETEKSWQLSRPSSIAMVREVATLHRSSNSTIFMRTEEPKVAAFMTLQDTHPPSVLELFL